MYQPSFSLAFSALNPGSALNPRTINPGTTVLTYLVNLCDSKNIVHCLSLEAEDSHLALESTQPFSSGGAGTPNKEKRWNKRGN